MPLLVWILCFSDGFKWMCFTYPLSVLLHCQFHESILCRTGFLFLSLNRGIISAFDLLLPWYIESFLASVFFTLFALCPINVSMLSNLLQKQNYVALRFALHWFKVKKKKVSRKKSLIDPESLVMSVCQEFLWLECRDSFIHVYRFHYKPIFVPKSIKKKRRRY